MRKWHCYSLQEVQRARANGIPTMMWKDDRWVNGPPDKAQRTSKKRSGISKSENGVSDGHAPEGGTEESVPHL